MHGPGGQKTRISKKSKIKSLTSNVMNSANSNSSSSSLGLGNGEGVKSTRIEKESPLGDEKTKEVEKEDEEQIGNLEEMGLQKLNLN